jgi:hypothetical protein
MMNVIGSDDERHRLQSPEVTEAAHLLQIFGPVAMSID